MKDEVERRDDMMSRIRSFAQRIHKKDGVTAIEYALIASAIAMAIIVTVSAVGDTLDGTYSRVEQELTENVGN